MICTQKECKTHWLKVSVGFIEHFTMIGYKITSIGRLHNSFMRTCKALGVCNYETCTVLVMVLWDIEVSLTSSN